MKSTKIQKGCCPRCRAYLEDSHFNGRPVQVCPRCAGLWVTPSAWDQETLGPLPHGGTASEPAGGLAIRPVGSSALPCPSCRTPLTALRVSGQPGDSAGALQIDQCASCGGVWLDHGEWEQIEDLRTVQAEEKRLEAPTTWGDWCFQLFLGLPVEFNVPPRRFPLVTVCLIALCVLCFLVELMVPDRVSAAYGFVPAQLFSGFGWVTLFTCMFLHTGWVHLLGNMYFLYILGDNIEDVLGRGRYLLFYLTCGVLGSLAYALPNLQSTQPLMGASGAIAGVIAAYLLLYPRARLTFMFLFWQFKILAPVWLGLWFLFQLGASFSDVMAIHPTTQVAHLAHVGGFLGGFVIIGLQRARLIAQHPLLKLLQTWRPMPIKQGIR
jgi:membrane associated rhomboid family serine protease